MTMSTHRRPAAFPFTAILQWLIGIATSMAARSLNMPEPLLHSTSIVVFAQVQAIETRALQSLCPARLWRQLRAYLR
jgi:xanthine/uracil permease